MKISEKLLKVREYEEEMGAIPTEYEDAIDDNMDDLKYMY